MTLRDSALDLSAAEGPDDEGAEVDGPEAGVGAGALLALVLRNTSRMERSDAGAMEYWVLSEGESGSTPNDSAMHWTGLISALLCLPSGRCSEVGSVIAKKDSPATSSDSLSSSLTVPSCAEVLRKSMLLLQLLPTMKSRS